jgi:xanthine dehydrogenase accessory factor
MTVWLDALDRLTAAGTPCVLVTVAAGKGSVPREAGAKMVVWGEAFAGTIGGGHLEFKAIEIAREMLAASAGLDVRRFPLGASLGQCCGGAATLLFEPVPSRPAWLDAALALEREGADYVVATAERGGAKAVVSAGGWAGDGPDEVVRSARTRLGAARAELVECGGQRWLLDPSRHPALHVVLFGAGHVGRAVARILGTLPCDVVWVDGRDHEFPADVAPNVRVEATDAPLAEVRAAPPDTCFLVMTHSHALDFDIGEAILARGDFRYFGLIGSRTKRRSFEQRLARRGLDASRMTCPIGVPGIAGKEPEVIAVAVAAQLLQLRAASAVARSSADAAAR